MKIVNFGHSISPARLLLRALAGDLENRPVPEDIFPGLRLVHVVRRGGYQIPTLTTLNPATHAGLHVAVRRRRLKDGGGFLLVFMNVSSRDFEQPRIESNPAPIGVNWPEPFYYADNDLSEVEISEKSIVLASRKVLELFMTAQGCHDDTIESVLAKLYKQPTVDEEGVWS